MSGKGSRRRPTQVTYDQYSKNWDRVFGKSNKDKEKEKRLKALEELTRQAQELDMGY